MKRNLTVEEAKREFPEAMADENAQYALTDPAGYDVLYVREDGVLVIGNNLDGFFDEWDQNELSWGESDQAINEWLAETEEENV